MEWQRTYQIPSLEKHDWETWLWGVHMRCQASGHGRLLDREMVSERQESKYKTDSFRDHNMNVMNCLFFVFFSPFEKRICNSSCCHVTSDTTPVYRDGCPSRMSRLTLRLSVCSRKTKIVSLSHLNRSCEISVWFGCCFLSFYHKVKSRADS